MKNDSLSGRSDAFPLTVPNHRRSYSGEGEPTKSVAHYDDIKPSLEVSKIVLLAADFSVRQGELYSRAKLDRAEIRPLLPKQPNALDPNRLVLKQRRNTG